MKRFTATEKWVKSWFQDLPPHLKCLWLYLCDSCDAAGVWDTNFKLASTLIGKTVSAKDMETFGGRVQMLPSGDYLVVPFIDFQYGKLSNECKAHLPVFRSLEKHSLSIPFPKGTAKTIQRVSNTLQEEDKDKDKDKEEDKDKSTKGSPEGKESPAPSEVGFEQFWAAYPRRVGKASAKTAWQKRGCAKLLPEILAAVAKCKASPSWTREAGQFIPHPATWLNREGWHDELPESPSKRAFTHDPKDDRL